MADHVVTITPGDTLTLRFIHLPTPEPEQPPEVEPEEPTPPDVDPTPEPEPDPPAPPSDGGGDQGPRGTLPKSYRWPRLADWNGTSTPGNPTGAVTEVEDPQGKYGTVLRFLNKAGAERAEVKADPSAAEPGKEPPYGHIPHGATYYAAFSLLLAPTYPVIPAGSGYMIVWQLHGVGDKLSPAMSIRTDSRGFVLRCRGGANSDTKEEFVIASDLGRGTWQHFVIAATASDTPAMVKVWHRLDGQQWRLAVNGRGHTAASHKNGQYYRAGEYGKPPADALLWQTGHALGNSFEEVAAK